MKRPVRCLWGVIAVGCLLPGMCWAKGVVDPLERQAAVARDPARAVLLDLTRVGNRLVAVGERGIVVLSDDGGQHWRQATVPTSVSLTAVAFPTAEQGWTVGHAGVVLHSGDGGETWARQLDGVVAARLALEAAQAIAERVGPDDEGARRSLRAAQYLVDDGPDKPFLDLAFEDEQRGFIVGAYNLIFRTEDGGRSWQPWMDRVDNPRGLHLYDIEVVGTTVYLAGEQGLFLRSDDAGQHFTRLETPYGGTYFAVAAHAPGEVMLLGLRGNAYRSEDRGETFTPVEVPIPVSFSTANASPDGSLLFANQAGFLLESRDRGRTLQPLVTPRLPPIAAVEQLNDGTLLTVGAGGVHRISLVAGANPASRGMQ